MNARLAMHRPAEGADTPDWLDALSKACARTSQAEVARELGRSTTVISQVLSGKYPASTARIAERVRGLYLNGMVECPALGPLSLIKCQDWRDKADTFAHGNPLRARMFRACNACPRLSAKEGSE